jgi:hypothetical protein
MTSNSRYALVAALGLAIAAVAPTTAVMAKKDKEASQSAPKLGDDVRKALMPAQQALEKKDVAAAEAAIAKARAAAKTPDERFVVAQFAVQAGQASGDQAKTLAALDELLVAGEAANRLTQAEKAKYYWFQGQSAYIAKDYAKAEQAVTKALANGSTEPDAPAVLADSQFRLGKSAEAVATLEKVIETRAAAGQSVPNAWFARGADIASRAKLPADFVKITTAWLAAYPNKQNWHDSLFIYRQMGPQTGEPDLDLLRLARAVGALPLAAQSNYLDYARAVYLKFPNEAVNVLNEGITAGKLNPATSQNTREFLSLSKPKIPADKASIPAAVTAANGPKATYKSALTTGDLLYGYGEFAKAADIYKVALAKPGADAAQANFRLGLALAQAGDKPGAKAAFNAVTSGPYAPLAGYAKVWVDHPAS